MAKSILFIFVILIYGEAILAHPFRRIRDNKEEQHDYLSTREQLIKSENRLSLGGKLRLNHIEARANEVLMTAKNREMHDGSNISLTIANSRDLSACKSVIVQINDKIRQSILKIKSHISENLSLVKLNFI